ncbi:VanZ family protein [Leucobacter chinensis]|uniref:VanZ family protein n=1 Tax=Leucobacter chinensis TaxID=2851010 RepID=UPI001C22EB25|nr:VanZ family protein [Leucobacter chinensis]
MSVWAWSAEMGVAIGVTVFFLALLPLLVWHYRSYGRLSVGRMLGAAAISVYAAALFAYTQLPLPPVRSLDWCAAHGVHELQLRPFASIETMVMRASEIGWGPMFASTLGLQVIFNVVLFVPFGVIVRGYFKRGFFATVALGALLSLAIEVTQATGMWGMYPCAYRLGDVDDLMTNTLGALLGALIAPLVLFWMPSKEQLVATRNEPRPVTGSRRVLALFLNYTLVWTLSGVLSWIIGITWRLIDGKIDLAAFAWVQFWLHAAVVAVVLLIPAMRGLGSLGMSIVWIAPRWSGPGKKRHSGAWWQRLARSAVLAVPLIASELPNWQFGGAVFTLIAIATLIMVPFTKTHRSLSGVLTGAELVDTRVGGAS